MTTNVRFYLSRDFSSPPIAGHGFHGFAACHTSGYYY